MKHTLKTLLTTTILISPSFASAEETLHMPSTGVERRIRPDDHPLIRNRNPSEIIATFAPQEWLFVSKSAKKSTDKAFKDALSHYPNLYPALEEFSPTYNAQDNGITRLAMLIFNMVEDLNNAGVLYGSDPMLSSEFLQAVKKLNLDVFTPLTALSAEALFKRATAGNTPAQKLYVGRLAYSVTIEGTETLLDLANKGWLDAQCCVSSGYAFGRYGIQAGPGKLLKLANQGWPEAQKLVVEGYADGAYGFSQDLVKLLELANQEWPHAQLEVVREYASGVNGFSKDTVKLLELANQGWTEAQDLVANGYANGVNGFTKNEDLGRFFEVYFKWKNFQLAKAAAVADGGAAAAVAYDGAAAADD